ncbi:MAG: hypothetical protein RBU30_17740 [Polyangia bacterium]|jgi:hypothetical protein|nr:hypothetical protein [Polyangia bacterium]
MTQLLNKGSDRGAPAPRDSSELGQRKSKLERILYRIQQKQMWASEAWNPGLRRVMGERDAQIRLGMIPELRKMETEVKQMLAQTVAEQKADAYRVAGKAARLAEHPGLSDELRGELLTTQAALVAALNAK